MAVYNELQVGRYVRLFQKFFSIKGRQPAPLQFSGEISSFLSLFHGSENRYLEGWNRFGSFPSVAAAATFLSKIQLRNPAASGVVIVVEKLAVVDTTASAAFTIRNQIADTDLAGPAPGTRLDSRGNAKSVGIISTSNTDATTPGLIYSGAQVPVNQSVDLILFEDHEITILPGDQMMVIDGTVNHTAAAALIWRERVLEESERA